ncbi:hypothetical protein [Ktedonobacter robiniae]|uniref:hypothetical protein n=1 Tax=Ktedonobacter robiniae TaxID=2778365 RepID=UPI001915FB46|nr:hypothetical protein [Ktedonobacter robiniae]
MGERTPLQIAGVSYSRRLRKMAERRTFASTVPWEMKSLVVLVERGSEWVPCFQWYPWCWRDGVWNHVMGLHEQQAAQYLGCFRS